MDRLPVARAVVQGCCRRFSSFVHLQLRVVLALGRGHRRHLVVCGLLPDQVHEAPIEALKSVKDALEVILLRKPLLGSPGAPGIVSFLSAAALAVLGPLRVTSRVKRRHQAWLLEADGWLLPLLQ